MLYFYNTLQGYCSRFGTAESSARLSYYSTSNLQMQESIYKATPTWPSSGVTVSVYGHRTSTFYTVFFTARGPRSYSLFEARRTSPLDNEWE